MTINNFFTKYYNDIYKQLQSEDVIQLIKVAAYIKKILIDSKKVIIVGNGGSAAIASHVSVDLTKAAQVRSINFNEADLITCYANDFGYENWVSEALKSYSDVDDLLILISSSGKSQNIINAAIEAKKIGLKIITLSGFYSDNPLRKLGDINLWVDSADYNIIEMTHHIWLLAIVDYVISENKGIK